LSLKDLRNTQPYPESSSLISTVQPAWAPNPLKLQNHGLQVTNTIQYKEGVDSQERTEEEPQTVQIRTMSGVLQEAPQSAEAQCVGPVLYAKSGKTFKLLLDLQPNPRYTSTETQCAQRQV